ncbi:ABC transporter ATP-binding protein [Trueperella bialowiezensis]|uniref:ABC-type quaternary amine transporter n=1 Tax=Trueperella bialowiezensis TaxID=312285 RepID=A0A3S4UYA8_9ACTO|nr:ABC transporter ATP-binding protein [Trueperella bialowiezensis]VEI12853.1 Sulfate/thiosulfate import ATP-binding protein CysA [Trueperella bialowiezensis]
MAQPHVQLRQIVKSFGDVTVLDGLNLDIEEGELVALLGPSGSGKSTCLRVLAGLETADSGEVLINGVDVADKPTRERNMGIVFQAYSLFPHLSATDNVAYGLKIRGKDTKERRSRAQELLELVGLEDQMDKFPSQMSGGQQQRVALARALAIEPDVLLLDEPLSALDAKVRVQLRDEIRRIQQSAGIATLMVTHDQEEAIVMADRVGVMSNGQIEQIGTPEDLYLHPRSPFISQFVGVANRVIGKVKADTLRVLDTDLQIVNAGSEAARGELATALIRPEQIVMTRDNSARYTVIDSQLRGMFSSITVQGELGKGYLRIDLLARDAAEFSVGDKVALHIARHDTVVDVPTEDEVAVYRRLEERWASA